MQHLIIETKTLKRSINNDHLYRNQSKKNQMSKKNPTSNTIESIQVSITLITLQVSTKIFDIDITARACYDLSDEFHIWLEEDGDKVRIELTEKGETYKRDIVKQRLGNLLIDHRLRKKVLQQTSHIRDQIVSAALTQAVPKA